MQSNSTTSALSDGYDASSSLGDNPARWLRETTQLDFRSSTVRILAKRITQLVSGERAKAVAIHDYVKSLPFACHGDYFNFCASDVIKHGTGDDHTKGVLFVALLRAVRMPARLRFVTLPTGFMRGLIDTGQPTMLHAVGEVLLGGRWYQTDTYVVDAPLSREARERLRAENNQIGYGVHAQADQDWNALDDAHTHYTVHDLASMPLADWGVAHDLVRFYDDPTHATLRPNFMARLKWQLGVHAMNRRIEKIRRTTETMVGIPV
jgi:Transglutaminase-like superfamily